MRHCVISFGLRLDKALKTTDSWSVQNSIIISGGNVWHKVIRHCKNVCCKVHSPHAVVPGLLYTGHVRIRLQA